MNAFIKGRQILRARYNCLIRVKTFCNTVTAVVGIPIKVNRTALRTYSSSYN